MVYLCEDTIWKQFTTPSVFFIPSKRVWFICAKIQFESNSQLKIQPLTLNPWCGLSVRRYNLKAIHNGSCGTVCVFCGVVYLCEDTIWKQFTTKSSFALVTLQVWFICAKIQFESNSQRAILFFENNVGCGLSVRRYNLKAIHNPLYRLFVLPLGVVYLCEDTIWKQFTTFPRSLYPFHTVWFICAKIQFESNSQRIAANTAAALRCGLSVRRYNLKAIHNA